MVKNRTSGGRKFAVCDQTARPATGEPGGGPGHGLTGLTERLTKAGGTLEAGGTRNGFRLTARVQVAASAHVGSAT